MELQQLIREIHWIEWQLRAFEDRYGILSRDFSQAVESGQLSEFDDGENPHFQEFLEWHGLYHVWLKRQQAYHERACQQPLTYQLRQAMAFA